MKEIVLVYAPDISGSLDSVIEGLRMYDYAREDIQRRYDGIECNITCQFKHIHVSIRGDEGRIDYAVDSYKSMMGNPIGTNYNNLHTIKRSE